MFFYNSQIRERDMWKIKSSSTKFDTKEVEPSRKYYITSDS
jgi:hypothetical protein